MQRKRSHLALLGILTLTLGATVGLTAVAADAKKKKGKAGGTVDITKSVFAPIPDRVGIVDGVLTSTIEVGGKKFKGTKIRDVNVALQTTGATGTSPAGDLITLVTAPNGATTYFFFGLSGVSIGPLTLDDESFMFLAGMPPSNSSLELSSPYQGTAQPQSFGIGSACLCAMDNGAVSGTWTFRAIDATVGETSVLNSWRLNVVAGRPFLTK